MKSSLIVIVLLSSNVFSSPFFFFSFVQCVIQFQACQAFVLKSSRWHCVGFNRLKSRSSYSLAVVVLSSSSKNKNDYYPAEVVQQIKDHVSIIDVIRDSGIQGLNVRDNNRRATALCPFHDDTNPSFAIVNDKHMKMYKCFGCGATGDIFTYLMQSNNNDITSFGQAVQFLLQNYCEPQLFLQNSTTTNAIITNATTRREEQHLRQRIQHANAAAALFYFQNLYKLPSAGLARQHLLELRGFTPEFIHQFRLGYAPATAPLVRHLSSLDFTPHEILQAGLAKLIIDKKNTNTTTVPLSTNMEEESHTTISTTTTTANHNVTQNDLKDRFINRLMIPIWDTDGKQVIGFGGRILQNNLVKNDSDTYNPPKYLNTQGTLIFQKRQILFGIHVASLALNTTTTTAAAAASDGPNKTHNWTSYSPPPSIIIVEGYMDALALYNVGIRNVAATMGTAISMEQLLLAVKVICNHSVPNRGTGNETPSSTTTTAVGKIILLMDQDEAGISAVERLCSTSQILQQLTTTNYSNTNTSNSTVDVMVASLPKGCKDPDEYIQHKRITLHNIESTTLKGINNINQPLDYEGSTMQQIFEHEIVQKALDWKDWYLNLLLSKHSSLANDTNVTTVTHSLLYDQVSDFISSFSNHQMQSYLAKQFVDQCANRLNEKSEKWDENSTHHVDSGTTANRTRTVAEYKIKLETDIWDMITKKLAKKERSLTQPVSSLNLRYVQRFDKSNNERRLSFIQRRSKMSPTRPIKPYGSRARQVFSKKEKVPSALIPHFQGFSFENQSDEIWLNHESKSSRERNRVDRQNSMILGRQWQEGSQPSEFSYGDELRTKSPVYFNSNSYLGYPETIQQLNKIYTVENIQENPDFQLILAEEKMLRTLIEYAPARKAMKVAMEHMQRNSSNGGTCDILEWSSSDRRWLFHKLVGTDTNNRDDTLPPELLDGGTPSQLHEFLRECQDAPPRAFVKKISSLENRGSKETTSDIKENVTFVVTEFEDEEEVKASITDERHSELDSTQENWNNMTTDNEIVPQFLLNNDSIGEEISALEEFLEDSDYQIINENSLSIRSVMSVGSLDKFFVREKFDPLSDPFFSSSELPKHETLADLIVQETVATMLRGSAMKKLAIAKDAWYTAKTALLVRTSGQSVKYNSITNHTAFQQYFTLDVSELEKEIFVLEGRLKHCMDTAKELRIAAHRIGSQLLDYSSTTSQRKSSTFGEDALAKALDEFVSSLPEDAPVPENHDNEDHFVMGYGGKKIFVQSKNF